MLVFITWFGRWSPVRSVIPKLVVLIALSPSIALAQYHFDSWTTNNGLPQNGLRAIAQTPDGYLWITTFDGLVRFDGVRFTIFNRSNSNGIHSNRFCNLYVDQQGDLWAATADQALTVYRQGQFTSYTPADGLPTGLRGPHGFEFKSNPQGEVLILTDKGWYQLRDRKFRFVEPSDQNQLRKTYLGPSGTRWTITKHAIYAVTRGQLTTYPFDINFPEVNPTVHLPNLFYQDNVHEDRQGNLWLGDLSGLYCLHEGKITFYGEDAGIPPNISIHSFWEEPDGSLWFATGDIDYPGVGLVQFKNNHFTIWGKEAGLLDDRIFSVFKDRESTVWLATNRGLNRLRHQPIKAYSTESGLLHHEVYPIFQTRNGDIWVGSTGGLTQIRGTTFTSYVLGMPQFDYAVTALGEDADGFLWIGALNRLFRWVNGKPRPVAGFPPWFITPVVIHSDRSGNVWVGTDGVSGGLFQFRGETLLAHYTTKDGLPSNDVKAIHEDRAGTLWVGTYGGLAHLVDGKWTVYTESNGLASNRVRALYEDDEGALWIGTYDNGLSCWRNGRFFTYRTEHGLFDNGVFCILEDHQAWFWISCNRGIYRVSRRQLTDFAAGQIPKIHCVAYNRQDGMLSTECNGGRQPAGIKANDGKLWFPTQDGVALLDPQAVSRNPLPPPVLIESVVLEREAVDFHQGITVLPGQDDLEITYTGLSLIKSEQTKFKYKLEGKDEDWVDAGTRRTAYYTYIPPGLYTFRVIAANSDDLWNLEGARVQILVVAPFWWQWWFWLACGFTLAGVIFLIVRSRIAELHRRQAAQIAFSRQLIESQETERKRIAAEMHDSLGQHLLVIKNWADLSLALSLPDAPNRDQLDEISETATTAINEVRQIVYDLRPYQLDKIGLTKTIQFMAEQVADSSGIHITADLDDLDGWMTTDQEIIFYRIVQECLNNIVKHSGAESAGLLIKHQKDGWLFQVSDNGCGFEADSAIDKPAGFGLTGLAERARMLGGELLLHSAPGHGTAVTIRFRE